MDSVADLLTSWGLCQYIETFQRNRITTQVLEDIDTSEMKLLIPDCVADIVLLRKKRDAWKAAQTSAAIPDLEAIEQYHHQDQGSSLPHSHAPNSTSDTNSTTDILMKALDAINEFPKSDWRTSTPWSSSCSSSIEFMSNTSEVPSTSGSSSSSITPTTPTAGIINQSTENIVFVPLDHTLIPNAILSSTLKDDHELLNMRTFKSWERQKVAKIVMKHIHKSCPDRVLATEELKRIQTLIVEQFPFEMNNKDVWLKSYSVVNGKKRPMSGILYETWRTVRNKSKRRGILEFKSRRRSETRTTNPETDVNKSIGSDTFKSVDNTVVQSYLQYLAAATPASDFASVKNAWTETSSERLRCLQAGEDKFTSIIEYFNTFSILRDPEKGPVLLKLDFDWQYPEKETALVRALLQSREAIINLAESVKRNTSRKDLLSSNLHTLLEGVTNQSDIEVQTAQCLLLLPYLTSVPATKKVKNCPWKPSRTEVSEGFIMHVSSSASVEPCRVSRIEKLTKMFRPTLPYVMYVGESFKNPSEVYCVVDNVLYPQHSIAEAVDLCFKIFFSVNCHYPEESQHLWLALQRGMYNIRTDYDKTSSPCTKLLSDLNLSI